MSSPRILAVDDEPSLLAALKRTLKRSQFVVETATSGRAGLSMVARDPPDLILLDVSMPCMSGHEFLRKLRRWESRRHRSARGSVSAGVHPRIPVIFLTALAAPSQRVSGLDAGATDYVTKPFEPDELRARIRNHLRRVQEQKDLLASKQAQLVSLEFSVAAALEAATECREQMTHLEECLDESGAVDREDQQQALVARTKEDIQNLTESLSSITKWLAARRTW
jgi:DNA-binding response OmpR family regulator